MSYIWEGYDRRRRFFPTLSTEHISPYLEALGPTQAGQGGMWVDLASSRLSSVFFPASATDAELSGLWEKYGHSPRYQDIARSILHLLARLDRAGGLSVHEIRMVREWRAIRYGAYGEALKKLFFQLSPMRQQTILACLARYDLGEQRENYYARSIQAVFPMTRLFLEKSTGRYYIYIAEDQTEENECAFNAIELLFKDIGTETVVMWRGAHFGIIGIDPTMQIDAVALV